MNPPPPQGRLSPRTPPPPLATPETRGEPMAKKLDVAEDLPQASPKLHQHGHEVQPYGHLVKLPIALAESAQRESVENLNQLLADTITLRDMYKKHHWQVLGPTFIQLHKLFDKHYRKQ